MAVVRVPPRPVPDEIPDDWDSFLDSRLGHVLAPRPEKGTQDRKTVDEVFDRSTLLALYKVMNGGIVDTLEYPISTGKEANVFFASNREGGAAVKIFRVNTATFRSLVTYIHGDPRFERVGPRFRDMIVAWTQKEYKNLQRLTEAGVRVPLPIAHHQNVLVMEFIGNAGTPAPLLKDRPPSDINASWQSITRQYAALVQKAGLVHGDLSEYNILNHAAGPRGEELVIIDVAQSVLLTHPMAQEFLDRDARNLARWFHKMGAKDATPEAFLAQVGRVAENRKKGGANS